jgi:hypothetical protein
MKRKRSIHNKRRRLPVEAVALKIATEFAGADLSDPATAGSWGGRIRDAFLTIGGVGQFIAFDAERGRMFSSEILTAGQLRTMQQDTVRLFTTLTGLRSGGSIQPDGITIGNIEISAIELPPTHRTLVMVAGTAEDVFRFSLVRCIQGTSVEKLRRCPDPKCNRFFFKAGKKDYCSTRCQSRVYMRKRRQEAKGARLDRTARRSRSRKG